MPKQCQALSVKWLPIAMQTNLQELIRNESLPHRTRLSPELQQAISRLSSSNQPALKLLQETVHRKSRYDCIASSPANWWAHDSVFRAHPGASLEAMLRVDQEDRIWRFSLSTSC